MYEKNFWFKLNQKLTNKYWWINYRNWNWEWYIPVTINSEATTSTSDGFNYHLDLSNTIHNTAVWFNITESVFWIPLDEDCWDNNNMIHIVSVNSEWHDLFLELYWADYNWNYTIPNWDYRCHNNGYNKWIYFEFFIR